MGGLYGALCSLRASQGQRADTGVCRWFCGTLCPVVPGEQKIGSDMKCLAGPVVAEGTGQEAR